MSRHRPPSISTCAGSRILIVQPRIRMSAFSSSFRVLSLPEIQA